MRVVITLQIFTILRNGFLYRKDDKNGFLLWEPLIYTYLHCQDRNILLIHVVGKTLTSVIKFKKIEWLRIIVTFQMFIILENAFLFGKGLENIFLD